MKDTSFIDLLKEENLNKIKIDDRLIPIFKIVMKNFQEYFNYMGYTKTRNYREFFAKYLISKYSISNIRIRCNQNPRRDDCDGYYKYLKKEIVIDESCLDDSIEAIDVLTHEFIHFLVEQYVKSNNLDDTLLYNFFVNEVYTEMLKLRILPLTKRAYLPQIEMFKLWLKVNNQKIDFNDFLHGKFLDIDQIIQNKFNEYLRSINTCEHIYNARNNIYYIAIQREIIKTININISTFEEYENIINKVAGRPCIDVYFMNKFYSKIETILCDNLKIEEKNNKYKYLFYLKEYRKIMEILGNSNSFKYIYSFSYDGDKYQIDNRKNLYIDENFEEKVKILKINKWTEELKIDLSKLNIKEQVRKNNQLKQELINKKERYKTILKYIEFINNSIEIKEYNDICLKKH